MDQAETDRSAPFNSTTNEMLPLQRTTFMPKVPGGLKAVRIPRYVTKMLFVVCVTSTNTHLQIDIVRSFSKASSL